MSFICHIHNYTEYNEEWNVFSAFNPSKCTHLEQWAADCAAPGEQSWTSCRTRDSNPQPWVTSGFKSNALSTRPTTALFDCPATFPSNTLKCNCMLKMNHVAMQCTHKPHTQTKLHRLNMHHFDQGYISFLPLSAAHLKCLWEMKRGWALWSWFSTPAAPVISAAQHSLELRKWRRQKERDSERERERERERGRGRGREKERERGDLICNCNLLI